MSALQYQAVYNVLSFPLASVTATTVHLGSVHLQSKTNTRAPSTVPDRIQRALIFLLQAGRQQPYILIPCIGSQRQLHECRLLSGVVTFIAAYHYFRVFTLGCLGVVIPLTDRSPLHEAYRYIDWLWMVSFAVG